MNYEMTWLSDNIAFGTNPETAVNIDQVDWSMTEKGRWQTEWEWK